VSAPITTEQAIAVITEAAKKATMHSHCLEKANVLDVDVAEQFELAPDDYLIEIVMINGELSFITDGCIPYKSASLTDKQLIQLAEYFAGNKS